MDPEPRGTRLALIMAGGELFAEHGLEGTGIRAIAEQAGAQRRRHQLPLRLQGEPLQGGSAPYAARQGRGRRAVDLVRAGAALAAPREVANAIRGVVAEWFGSHFAADDPPWRSRFFARSMVEPADLLKPVVNEVLKPDTEALMTIFRSADPSLSEEAARLWAFGMISQFSFFLLFRSVVLALMDRDDYDQEFLDAAAARIIRTTVNALGLPDPD